MNELQEQWVRLDNTRFSFKEIQKGNYSNSLISIKKSALDFCREWLNGKEKFQLQTSGSTGTPKTIEVTRDQLKASARLSTSVLGLQKDFTALVCLDTRYIAGVMMLVRSLEVGMNMIIVEPSSNPLAKIEDETSIDFTAWVPLQLESILKSEQKEKLNNIKIALIGGAAINHKTVKEIETLPCNFFATYGMTETLSHIALQKLNGKDAQDFFEALPKITLSKDERECLIIRASHISDQPIVTNDLVDLISPTQFRWIGRVDNIINTGGVKVIPEKIEASISIALNELAVSNRFFVAALPDSILGESVHLFIEGSPFKNQIEELIQKKLFETHSKYERPKSIQYIPAFINTDTGKINKSKTIASIQN